MAWRRELPPCGRRSDVAVDESDQLAFAQRPYFLGGNRAVFEQDQCRNTADTESCRGDLVRIDIHLGESDLASVFP